MPGQAASRRSFGRRAFRRALGQLIGLRQMAAGRCHESIFA